MSRETVGLVLSARLFAAESAVGSALTEAASLVAMPPSARAEAYLSAVSGQRAFDAAAASISALTLARAHMVTTHKTLSAIARTPGLEAQSIGPMDKPEDAPANGGSLKQNLMNVVNKPLPYRVNTW